MSLQITSLNSGSNGNCYYVGNSDEAVLVDAGISCRETEKRMQLLGLSMQRVKAIFISHEHTDHVRGLQGIAEKYQLPVYITLATLRHSSLLLKKELVVPLRADTPVNIGALCITAFPKYHDAADPHSFTIACRGTKVGVFTDIGAPCSRLVNFFRQCHAAFLESNYDEQLLDNGRYPLFLKNRIRGGRGHLSNKQAVDLFISHRPPFMSHLLLAHLSKDNNCPEMVQQLFELHAAGITITVASRFCHTPLFEISAGQSRVENTKGAPSMVVRPKQLTLF